eukprot:comp21509_c0_seq1/m.46941 comp21509_c0_seq1/g.46941  ORF comp21509_c0_seq1/g.46941 comp21509_c0_seq1/m.46941 type:complete len:854 (-) comp21509_c0_seq1:53-2614(-)
MSQRGSRGSPNPRYPYTAQPFEHRVIMDLFPSQLNSTTINDSSYNQSMETVTGLQDEIRRLSAQLDAAKKAKADIEMLWQKDKQMFDAERKQSDPRLQQKAFQDFLDSSPHISLLQKRLNELEAQNTQLKNDLLDAEHRYEFVNTARDLLKSELSEVQQQLFSVTAKGPEHIAEFSYVQQQLQKMRDEAADQARSDAIRIANLEADLTRTREELTKALNANTMAKLEAEYNDLKFEKELASEAKVLLEQQLGIANEDRMALREDLEYSRNSMQVLKDTIQRLEAQNKQERLEHVNYSKQVTDELAELEKYRREWREMQDNVNIEREILKKEVAEVNLLLSNHLAGRDTESLATQKLIQDIERSKERTNILSSDLEKARAENNRLRVELLELRENLNLRLRESETEKEKVMRRTVEIAQNADQAIQENEQLHTNLATIKATNEVLKDERDNLATECLRLRNELEKTTKELEEIKEERRRDHNDFASYATKMREHRDALTRAKSHNQELVDEVVSLRNQIAELKLKYQTVVDDSKRDLEAEHLRLSALLEHERSQREKEREILEAKLKRAEETIEIDWNRSQTEIKRLQDLLDKAREECILERNKIPSLIQERERLLFELERTKRLIPPLESQIKLQQDELTKVRHESALEGKQMAARLDQYEIRAAEKEQLETRNADLFKEVQQLRYDNARLVSEVRRWKDKRVAQLVNTSWSENLFKNKNDEDENLEEAGWMDSNGMREKINHENSIRNNPNLAGGGGGYPGYGYHHGAHSGHALPPAPLHPIPGNGPDSRMAGTAIPVNPYRGGAPMPHGAPTGNPFAQHPGAYYAGGAPGGGGVGNHGGSGGGGGGGNYHH